MVLQFSKNTLNLNHQDFPTEEVTVKEIWVGERNALMITHPKKPKNIFLFGIDRTEAETLANAWRSQSNSELAG